VNPTKERHVAGGRAPEPIDVSLSNNVCNSDGIGGDARLKRLAMRAAERLRLL